MKDVLVALEVEIAVTERKLDLLRSAQRELAAWSTPPVEPERAKRKVRKRAAVPPLRTTRAARPLPTPPKANGDDPADPTVYRAVLKRSELASIFSAAESSPPEAVPAEPEAKPPRCRCGETDPTKFYASSRGRCKSCTPTGGAASATKRRRRDGATPRDGANSRPKMPPPSPPSERMEKIRAAATRNGTRGGDPWSTAPIEAKEE